MSEKEEIRRKAIERAGNTVVQCPYCKEIHTVASGWFFIDNPQASRNGEKIGSQYITKQLDNFLQGKE